MSLRRPVALATGALLLGAPALTACGFDYPTNRVNTITNGASDREKTVYVLNALVVASRPNSGTVITTLSNSSNRDAVRLTSVTATNGQPLEVIGDADVALLPSAAANLASDPTLRVSGDFEAGQFIRLTFAFDNGEQTTVQVPVVTDCDEYDGLDAAPTPETTEDAIALPEYECGVSDEVGGHSEGDETE